MGNLFIEEGLQFVSIHMKDVIDVAVVNSVQTVPKVGEEKEQFKNFVKEWFAKGANLLQIPEEKQTTKRSFQKTKLK